MSFVVLFASYILLSGGFWGLLLNLEKLDRLACGSRSKNVRNRGCMHSMFSTLLVLTALSQIETSRPRVGPLEAKYRTSTPWQGREHHVWFHLGSPVRVGHWVVFSIAKTRGGFGSADFGNFARRRPKPVVRPACLEGKPSFAPWCGLVAYDLDSGRAVQLTPPVTGRTGGPSTWVEAHFRWGSDRCAVEMMQSERVPGSTEQKFGQFLWEWNLEQGTVKPVGAWYPARLFELALDPRLVEVREHSNAAAKQQTFEIRDKATGHTTRVVTGERLEPDPDSDGAEIFGLPAVFSQPDRRSALFCDLVEPRAGQEREIRIECLDPRAADGRRWTITAAEIQKATGQKPDSIRSLANGQRRPDLIALYQEVLAGPSSLLLVNATTGKIDRVLRFAELAEGGSRTEPVFLGDGAGIAYLETHEATVSSGRSSRLQSSTQLVSIDAKTGAELSRTDFHGDLSSLSRLLGVDARGRILIASMDSQNRLDRITLDKSPSLERLFTLDPSDRRLAASYEGGQQTGQSGAAKLRGAKKLASLDLSATEVSDAMLVELGRIDTLKHLEFRIPQRGLAELGRLQSVTSLDLSGDITESVARQLRQLSQLTQLDAQLGSETSAGTLRQLSALPHLASFRLTADLEEEFKAKYLQGLTNVTSLSLLSEVNDDDLAAFSKLENLTQLDLRADITGAGIRHLKRLPKLVDLRLSLNGIREGAFDEIVMGLGTFAHLKRLRLADENTLSRNVLARLGGLRSLTDLDLSDFGVDFNAGSIEGLAACRDLTRLNLTHYSLRADDMRELLRLGNLKQLDLSGLKELQVQVEELGRLTNLEELDLYAPEQLCGKLTDGCLPGFRGLTRLKTLCLSGQSISDAGLKELADHKALVQLRLAHTQITDGGLQSLSLLENLADLDLFHTAITDAGLKELSAFRGLRALDVGLTQVTDAGLKHLAGAKRLRRLNLQANSITDAGLKEVSAIESLEELNLSATNITDAGLVALKGLKNLRKLDLRRTAITDAGLRELRDLPRLTKLVLGR
jgi:internalin A